MKLSILIVNWNSKDLLRQCLQSLRAHCSDLELQIVVVDGGSFDGCAEMVAAEFPEVDFVQSQDNIGFGRANNLAFKKARGDAVLLLNPDTEVRPGAVQALLAELNGRPDAGIIGPRLLNSDFTLQHSVHALPRPVRQAFDSEILRRVLWPFSLWAPPSDFAPRSTVQVEAVSGACMLLWSKTYADVGGFSAQYFMYAEDMDLCFKVVGKGWNIYHVPHAEILHHSGASASSQGSAFSAVMTREALYKYMMTNHGPAHAVVYKLGTGCYSAGRLLIACLRLLIGSAESKTEQQGAYLEWRAVLSWSLGGERWTKRYR